VGERTEFLCKKLILEQGVSENAIFVINEMPFSRAMRVGFEIGLSENRPWTFCIDADVLLRPGSIACLLAIGEKQPPNVCEIQGYVLDKFFGGARQAGNHLYRTSLLPQVIERIPSEGRDIRPETYALNAMRSDGYSWHTVKELVGLHDFEQAYEDIFRKCFVHAHKHLNHTELFVPFWRSKSSEDMDYQAALAGFSEGIKYFDEVRIDKRAEYFRSAMCNYKFILKNEIDLIKWDINKVESIINCWIDAPEYKEKFPYGISAGFGTGIFVHIFEKYKWHRNHASVSVSAREILSWLLISAGKKLRMPSILK
jgi:hypothetical protein